MRKTRPANKKNDTQALPVENKEFESVADLDTKENNSVSLNETESVVSEVVLNAEENKEIGSESIILDPKLKGFLEGCDEHGIRGWAMDENNLDKPVKLAVFIDGGLVTEVNTDSFRQDLLNSGMGEGRCAFNIPMPDKFIDGVDHAIEIMEVLTGWVLPSSNKEFSIVAEKINDLSEVAVDANNGLGLKGVAIQEKKLKGYLEAADVYSIRGWAIDDDSPNEPVAINVFIDDELIVRISANVFRQDLLNSGMGNGQCAFQIPMPDRFFDGLEHKIELTDIESNEVLHGCPKFFKEDYKAYISELFDARFYLSVYSDIRNKNIDPLKHYFFEGWKEGRDPSQEFSSTFYLKSYSDVQMMNMNPLLHYVIHGKHSGYSVIPSRLSEIAKRIAPYFDIPFYLESYPDIKEAGLEPITHYLEHGWKENRNPNIEFCTSHYLKLYPDIAKSHINPFVHYLLHGRNEGRLGKMPSTFRGIKMLCDIADENVTLSLPVITGNFIAKVTSQSKTSEKTIAIHLHAYYLERLDDALLHLHSLPYEFDLYITSDSDDKLDAIKQCVQNHKLYCQNLHFIKCINRGRDIAPFFVEVGKFLFNYDYVLHIHLKQTKGHEKNHGDRWFDDCMRKLLLDHVYMSSIFSLFEKENHLGIIMPEPFSEVVSLMNWGLNKDLAIKLLGRMNISETILETQPLFFPAGSMFWFRPDALKQLFEIKISYDDFPPEPVGEDGTLAHAIERSILYIAKHNGFTYKVIKPLSAELMPPQKASHFDVSIIIPVLNGLPWLHHAIQSVLQQDDCVLRVEIIIVDNGSTDGSIQVSEFYQNNFPNIRSLSQSEHGAGAARNLGLEYAKGEYVFFLDADDMLILDGVEKLLNIAIKNDSDMVVSPLIMFNEFRLNDPAPNIFLSIKDDANTINIKRFAGRGANFAMTDTEYRSLQAVFSDFGPCAKLYRNSFLRKNKLSFPHGVNYEDNYFIYSVYLNAEKLSIANQPSYLYRRYKKNVGTTQSTSFDSNSLKDQLNAISTIAIFLEQIDNTKLSTIMRVSCLNKLQWYIEEGIDLITSIMDNDEEILSQFQLVMERLCAERYLEANSLLCKWIQ